MKLACRPLSNQSRLVLISTGCLLLGGTLLAWLLEMDNSKTIGTLNVWQQLLVSFFQTVTMRTAGLRLFPIPMPISPQIFFL